MISVHREDLGLGGGFHEGLSILLGGCIGLKVGDVLQDTPIVVVNDDIVYSGNLLL